MQFWILSEGSQAGHAALLLQALQRFKEGGVKEEGETKAFAIQTIPLILSVSHESLKQRCLSARFDNRWIMHTNEIVKMENNCTTTIPL